MMPKGWRRRGRTLLLLFVLLAPFFIVTSSTTLHRLLLEPVRRAAGIDIQFKRSGVSFLHWDFRIQDIHLSDLKKTFEFESPRIRISISPLSLIKGQLIISKFEVDSPHLRILKKSEGKKRSLSETLKGFFTNYERSFLLRNIVVKKVRVGSLRIERPGEAPLAADEFGMSLEPMLDQSIRGRLSLKGFSQGRAPLALLKIDFTLGRNGGEVHSFELSHEGTELSLSASWKGDLEKGKLAAEGKVFSRENLTEPVTFQIESDLEKSSARIKKISARMGTGKLEGNGSFNLISKNYDIDFQAWEVPLELIFQKLDSSVLSPARGIGEVKGKARGTLPKIAIDAVAAIHNLHHNKLYAYEAAGSIGLHWPLLHFKALVFPAEGEGEVGEVTGGVLFQRHSPEEKIRARLDKLDLSFRQAPLSKFLPFSSLSGILTGELHLQGAEKEGEPTAKGTGQAEVLGGSIGVITVESLQTRLKLEPGGIMLFEETLLQLTNLNPTLLPKPIRLEGTGESLLFSGNPIPGLRFKGKYDYQTKEIALEQLVVHSEKGDFQAEGNYRERLDFRLKGPFQVSFLQIFRSLFGEVSGWGAMDLKIGGTTQDPDLNGVVSFQDAMIEMRNLKETVSNLSGKMLFREKKVTSDLGGRLGNGNFSLKGAVLFEGLQPDSFDLKLNGTGLPVSLARDLSLEINGDLKLTGAASDPLLSGKIEIADGLYT
ncbi:MAG: translocation/assembly module TamB domain-containing protein, partial [Deltaproteobacteria bacterium]|nr:translocation/assembly module TamB domain-containing protein [Deltaproteobacteria bacterium]